MKTHYNFIKKKKTDSIVKRNFYNFTDFHSLIDFTSFVKNISILYFSTLVSHYNFEILHYILELREF